MESDEWLAGRDEVAVLDEPLDHLAAVGGAHLGAVTRAGDIADGAPGSSMSASAASAERWKVPFVGETTISQVGVVSIIEASPCLAQKARASSSWSGVLSAKSRPGHRPLGDPGQGAAGASRAAR